jgi:hypothetical protein
VSRRRWIFILTIIVRRRNQSRNKRRHKRRRWNNHRISLAGQEIFIKFNISSNNNFITMWLKKSVTFDIFRITNKYCYPRYLGITRRSCLEAHMVLDMEYREQERLEHGPGGPIFLLLSQTRPVSSTSFHHYRPELASERTLAP